LCRESFAPQHPFVFWRCPLFTGCCCHFQRCDQLCSAPSFKEGLQPQVPNLQPTHLLLGPLCFFPFPPLGMCLEPALCPLPFIVLILIVTPTNTQTLDSCPNNFLFEKESDPVSVLCLLIPLFYPFPNLIL